MTELPLAKARQTVSEMGREMVSLGLTEGTGGNVSERGEDDLVAVSPTRIPYDDITAEDVPVVDLDGEQVAGETTPSSETPMHTMIYSARDDVGGVVHTHSHYASTFAILGEPILPAHYLTAYIGEKVPVAGFDQPGSAELGQHAVDALGDEYDACLLLHHGVMAVGDDLEDAMENALMVEYCAQVYYQARCIGEPQILEGEDLDQLIAGFDAYTSLDV